MNRRYAIFGLFTAAYFCSYFYRSANAVIAADLAQDMLLDAAQLGLMTSLFFASFAAVQLPLGLGLDRWGPRWVTPFLLLVAAVGSLVFAAATSFVWLAIGRVLMGLGMAGVLMGSLKIFSQWFSTARFATVSGLLVGIGALGALAAATPLAWLNELVGWRAVFATGSGLVIVVAVSIMLWTRNAPGGVTWAADSGARGRIGVVLRDGRFWRIAPLAFCVAGGLMAYQGLWAGPYLFDVQGMTSLQAGNLLLILNGSAMVGFLASGWLVDRYGLAQTVTAAGALFGVSQAGLALRPSLVWVFGLFVLFGFTGAFNVMIVAQTRRIFPLTMTGIAVSTANLFAIGGTFLIQWWMGLIINAFPVTNGHYAPMAYSAALGSTAAMTLIAWVWYLPLMWQGARKNNILQ